MLTLTLRNLILFAMVFEIVVISSIVESGNLYTKTSALHLLPRVDNEGTVYLEIHKRLVGILPVRTE